MGTCTKNQVIPFVKKTWTIYSFKLLRYNAAVKIVRHYKRRNDSNYFTIGIKLMYSTKENTCKYLILSTETVFSAYSIEIRLN